MTTTAPSAQIASGKPRTGDAGRATTPSLVLYFALAFLAQGTSQQWGIVAQPLEYYLMRSVGMSAAGVANLMALLLMPWVVKPLYGLLSDFVPVFGRRRRTYLFFAHALTAAAFVCIALNVTPDAVTRMLLLSAVGMAMVTTLLIGLSVESGDGRALTRRLQSLQGVAYYGAGIASSILGGWLCAHLPGPSALKVGALAAAALPIVAMLATPFLVADERVRLDPAAAKTTALSALSALRSRRFWLVALFMCLWNFSPGFGVPLYFHESNVLGFPQAVIGQLSAVNGAGMMLGAFVFMTVVAPRLSSRTQIWLAVILGTASTGSYLALTTPESAVALELFRGFANITAILGLYGIASDVCPRGAEATTMACLVSMYNVAGQVSLAIGGHLYSNVLDHGFRELVVISAAATALTALLVPFLPGNRGAVKASG